MRNIVAKRAFQAGPIAAFLAVLGSTAGAQTSGAGFEPLLKRLPARANAVLMVDAQALFASPLAQRDKWQEKMTESARYGLNFPKQASKVLVATHLDFATVEDDRTLTLVQMKAGAPDLKTLATIDDGYVDESSAGTLVWSPRRVLYATFPPDTLAIVSPPDRQSMVDWMRDQKSGTTKIAPAFADRPMAQMGKGAQIVLALDLADAMSMPVINQRMEHVDAVAQAGLKADTTAKILATARAATLSIKVGNDVQGTLQVDFEQPVGYLKAIAKPLILTAVDDAGASIDELANWEVSTTERTITMTGPVGQESLRRIMSLLRPAMGSAEHSSSASAERAEAAATDTASLDPAQASKRYFDGVNGLLDGLKQQPMNSSKSGQLWYARYAERIEELPILGVDSELLDWGSSVSRTLRELSSGINYAKNNQTYQISGNAGSYGGSYYGGYGYYGGNSKKYDATVFKRQNAAMVDAQLSQIWNKIDISSADIRRKMVEKFKVEF